MHNHNPDLENEFEGGDIEQNLIPNDEISLPEVTVRDRSNWPWFFCKAPGVEYQSLGDGHYCEISDCGRQAYTFCD